MSIQLVSPKPIRSAEPSGLAAIRGQAAIVRTLVDTLEQVAPHGAAARAVREQLVEELTRLGCRMLEAASALAEHDGGEESGVHAVADRAIRRE